MCMCVCVLYIHTDVHVKTHKDRQAFIEPELLNRSRWLRYEDLQGERIHTALSKFTKSSVSAGSDSRVSTTRVSFCWLRESY